MSCSRFTRRRTGELLGALAVLSLLSSASSGQETEVAPSPGMKVVILGTGTPNADPDRSGPAVAVVVGDRAYLIDAGPGIVRRASAASSMHDLEALAPSRLDHLFLTHLHSDHTVGLPDVMLSPWVLDRPGPLRVVGPPGTDEMVRHVLAGWRQDIDMRVFGLEPRDENVDAYKAPVEETTGGEVLDDGRVRVTAIPVYHGSWPHALGYRFEAGGRVVVISGDARPSESVVEACMGCDVLVHEVYSSSGFDTRPAEWQTYHASFHTSTKELAALAGRARPKMLVLYHQLYWGATDEDLIAELRAAGYQGEVSSAVDLDIY